MKIRACLQEKIFSKMKMRKMINISISTQKQEASETHKTDT